MTDKREGGTPRTNAVRKPNLGSRLYRMVKTSTNIWSDSQLRAFAGFADEADQLERDLTAALSANSAERAAGFAEAREAAAMVCQKEWQGANALYKSKVAGELMRAIAALRQEGTK